MTAAPILKIRVFEGGTGAATWVISCLTGCVGMRLFPWDEKSSLSFDQVVDDGRNNLDSKIGRDGGVNALAIRRPQ